MSQLSTYSYLSSGNGLTTESHTRSWFGLILLGVLTAALGSWIIGDFSHPLSDGSDTDQFEYVGYFFTKNLSFNPFPHLNLTNTQTFYPYGTNQVFLDWGFERDYWYRLCYVLFGGPGPYLQTYYLYTLLVTSLGTYILLQTRFGVVKSIVVSLIVSVFNFYAIWKFPVHMNVCVGHWTTLCIVATYRFLYDVVNKKLVSLPYVLFWVWMHVQILGQELGYVAGFALTFTTLVLPVLAVILYQRFRTTLVSSGIAYAQDQWERHKSGTLFWLLMVFFSLYLYLPLTLQIAFTAWEFNFGAVPELRAWSHPIRLFLPYLPGIDSYDIPYQRWFRDTFESYGQGSPGLYLTLLAGIGFWQIRRRMALWLPIVLMLVLCLLYHPVVLPTLKLFPWFSFNRHGGRASLVYPVLLCLLALPINWPRRRLSQVGVALLLGLMLAEWSTGYYLRLFQPVNVASDSLLRYCAIVREQPGVAVLDWPFCTVGANGVGAEEGLCPYYRQQNAVFTFRRFYDKSGVGQYFGRLHPDQIQPFLRDGWPQRLQPNYSFTNQDWQFLDRFLQKNNFAGINLYPDLLTPHQVAVFEQHYGSPIAETRFPAAGKVVFIPLKK
ncbi:hypothetical protein [Spirosoma sp.]|uniref:hypothetical protein n=1 Tax=Spirosoma sp. TaxID=1899569 RepID=UPI003B3B6360